MFALQRALGRVRKFKIEVQPEKSKTLLFRAEPRLAQFGRARPEFQIGRALGRTPKKKSVSNERIREFSFWSEDLLQLVQMVFYPPPTATIAESTFSFQKWLIGSRRTSMKPATCNARVVGKSIMSLKRKFKEAESDKEAKRIKL